MTERETYSLGYSDGRRSAIRLTARLLCSECAQWSHGDATNLRRVFVGEQWWTWLHGTPDSACSCKVQALWTYLYENGEVDQFGQWLGAVTDFNKVS